MTPRADEAPASAGDPDLPPRRPAPPLRLDTVADLVAAVDRLATTAQSAGFVSEAADPVAGGTITEVSAIAHPVLARLAQLRPTISGVRPLVGDPTVRLALGHAYSGIEALDYLMRAESRPSDPRSTAVEETMQAILAAHQRDCTCSD